MWLFHTVTLFWKVAFPFHARSFDVTRRTKYIHIACVIAGILIPLIPIIASVATSAVDFKSGPSTNISFLDGGLGFRVTRFPPILCTGSDRDVVFYSVVLPLDISLTIGCSLLIIMFWIIHKVSSLLSPLVPSLSYSGLTLSPTSPSSPSLVNDAVPLPTF